MISVMKLYMVGITISLAGRMAYRTDFFISMAIMLIAEFLTPLVTILIYRSGASFPGWGLYEVMLIQAIFMLSRGVAFPFFIGILMHTLDTVRAGTFDLLLIKPRPTLMMVMVTGFDSEDLGKMIGGMLFLIFSLAHLPTPGFWQWILCAVMFIFSLLVQLSFILLMSGTVFKWVGNGRVFEIFDSVASFGLYPASIFSKLLQNIIIYIIPISIIGFIPASAMLGKSISGIGIASIVSILFLIISLAFWHKMLRGYKSAGG